MPSSRACSPSRIASTQNFGRTLDDLESAKEELRSINEELMTLDQDNRARLEELAARPPTSRSCSMMV